MLHSGPFVILLAVTLLSQILVSAPILKLNLKDNFLDWLLRKQRLLSLPVRGMTPNGSHKCILNVSVGRTRNWISVLKPGKGLFTPSDGMSRSGCVRGIAWKGPIDLYLCHSDQGGVGLASLAAKNLMDLSPIPSDATSGAATALAIARFD